MDECKPLGGAGRGGASGMELSQGGTGADSGWDDEGEDGEEEETGMERDGGVAGADGGDGGGGGDGIAEKGKKEKKAFSFKRHTFKVGFRLTLSNPS